jgi:hypothetical protein
MIYKQMTNAAVLYLTLNSLISLVPVLDTQFSYINALLVALAVGFGLYAS